MLIQLLPKQISDHWETIKFAIQNSLPPVAGESPDKLNRILMNLLDGSMQCWVRVDDKKRVNMILVTAISEDYCSGTKNLLIYCAYGFGSGHRDMWIDIYRTFFKFGKSKGCHRCIVYSDNEYLVDILKWLGGNAQYKMITFAIGDLDEGLH